MRPEVDTLLRKAEYEAERIVSLARMAAALGLLTFFVVSIRPPDSLPQEAFFRVWVLAIGLMLSYLALGVLTWMAVRHRWFRRWMILPTALLDAGFAVAAVLVGLLNSDIGGSAMFAFPAVWLVPVVLAFGILRGDPAAMAASSVALLLGLGWLALLPEVAGGIERATRLFLSGPPNLMRLVMIALAGAVLTLAAWRARALLRSALEASLRSANLTRYLPAALAPQLAEGRLEELRRGRHENLAVLFIDIRGFTAMSETASERELLDFVTGFRHEVAQVVDRHGGVIDKFIGDAAMVVFSDPEKPSRAAASALDCAVALDAAIAAWSNRRQEAGQTPVQVGVGVHFGPVFSGVVGDETRLEYSVFGDTVNVAARLEQLTRELGRPVLTSRETVEAADATGWHEIARRPLRGRDGEVAIMAPVAAG